MSLGDLWIPSSARQSPEPPQHEKHCTHAIKDNEPNPTVRLRECCGCWDIFIQPVGIEFEEYTHGYAHRGIHKPWRQAAVRRWDVLTRKWI